MPYVLTKTLYIFGSADVVYRWPTIRYNFYSLRSSLKSLVTALQGFASKQKGIVKFEKVEKIELFTEQKENNAEYSIYKLKLRCKFKNL